MPSHYVVITIYRRICPCSRPLCVLLVWLLAPSTVPPEEEDYPCYADDPRDRVGTNMKKASSMSYEVSDVHL